MKHFKVYLSFVVGCLVATLIGQIVVHVKAQAAGEGGNIHVCAAPDGTLRLTAPIAACPNGQRSLILKKADSAVDEDKSKEDPTHPRGDKAKLDDLDQRLKKLESADCSSLGKSKVVAPFEVVDRAGKRIFYVDNGVADLFNSAGKDVAWMSASNTGGNFVAKSATADLTTTFGSSGESNGLTVTENGNKRIDLGRRPDRGTYRVIFSSKTGSAVAGIGQSQEITGLVFVADAAGVIRARMTISNDDKGRITVTRSSSGESIAELTEGAHGGGKLFICSPAGCDPPMVEAGDAGGYGIVRAGPMGFNPGVGLLGLPGSFIMGKQQ
jgi:hypothetical protein